MADKINLRDFQEHLAGRLNNAGEGEAAPALLGVQAGDDYWLLDLSDSGEIVPLPPVTSVPLTKSWFAGIVNVRGNLYVVADFSIFNGGNATPFDGSAQLLLVGTRHGSNAALLVSRIFGLKNPALFSPSTAEHAKVHPWESGRLVDMDGREWLRLDVPALLRDREFMEIGI